MSEQWLMPPPEQPSKLPTLTTEEWLQYVRKLEDAYRNAADERNRYRVLLCSTWALIGILLTVLGMALSGLRPHAGIAPYCVIALGVAIAWYSIRLTTR